MAELQRHKVGDLHYTDEEQRHILDLIIAERGQLQRNLDAAYAALREKDRRELDSAISAGWSEADAHYMPQIEQLQHDLDAAYAALWDAGPFYDDHEEMQWRTENEAILKKAHDAIIQKAKKAKEAKDGTV